MKRKKKNQNPQKSAFSSELVEINDSLYAITFTITKKNEYLDKAIILLK